MRLCLTQLPLCLAKASTVSSPRHSSSLSNKGRHPTASPALHSGSDTTASITTIACARAAIAKLRDDNAKLKEELLLENKFSVTPTSSNLSANIANLQDQSDVYTRKVTSPPLHFLCLSAAPMLLKECCSTFSKLHWLAPSFVYQVAGSLSLGNLACHPRNMHTSVTCTSSGELLCIGLAQSHLNIAVWCSTQKVLASFLHANYSGCHYCNTRHYTFPVVPDHCYCDTRHLLSSCSA